MAIPSVLERIVAAKREEIAEHKRATPLADLERRIADLPPTLNLSGALLGDATRLIAEVKKASPSRGLLRPDFDPAGLATTYAQNGAAAISVLTDQHFQGTLAHLTAVKKATRPFGTPVLRKDFILEPYQLYEARAAGADAGLLIVACLSPADLRSLLGEALRLWLQCLVEVHSEEEMRVAAGAGAEIIGINNRDLHTFETDLAVTERLAKRAAPGTVVVAESGIFTRDDVRRVRRAGAHAVLVGEAIVTASDVAAKVRELAGQPGAAPI